MSSKLNQDLLLEIILRATDPLQRDYRTSIALEAFTLRSASQVNREWRAVTLNHSPFWGKVLEPDSSKYIWFSEVLNRSRQSPLYLLINLELETGSDASIDKDGKKIFSLIHQHFERCAHLEVNLPRSTAYEFLFLPAPRLRTCRLGVSAGLDQPSVDRLSGQKTPFRPLFAGQAPLLESLQLSGCAHHSPVPHFPSLSTPSLTMRRSVNMALVRQFTKVKNLCLDTMEISITECPFPIDLPNLQGLHLSGSMTSNQAILDKLFLPSSCSIAYFAPVPHCASAGDNVAKTVWKTLFRHFSGAHIEKWHISTESLAVHVGLATACGRLLYIGFLGPEETLDDQESPFFSCTWTSLSDQFPQHIESATSLSMRLDPGEDIPSHFYPIFSSMHRVHTLRLDLSDDDPDLTQYSGGTWLRSLLLPSIARRSKLQFPALKVLALSATFFNSPDILEDLVEAWSWRNRDTYSPWEVTQVFEGREREETLVFQNNRNVRICAACI